MSCSRLFGYLNVDMPLMLLSNVLPCNCIPCLLNFMLRIYSSIVKTIFPTSSIPSGCYEGINAYKNGNVTNGHTVSI